MSEQVLKQTNTMERSKIRTMVQIAMLGALSGLLMNFEFPLPFLAPPFYQMDFSEVPALVGTFAMGPMAGALIELVKILIHLVTKGTTTAGVGDIASYIMGCSFLIPAGFIYNYKHKKTRKHAVIGMVTGTVCTTIVACITNAYILLPLYGKAFGMPISAFVEMGAAVNSAVCNVLTFVVLLVAPFNIFKWSVVSIIVLLIYKRIRVILKG